MKKILASLVLMCLFFMNISTGKASEIQNYASNGNYITYEDYYNNKKQNFVLLPNGTSSYTLDRVLSKLEKEGLKFPKLRKLETKVQLLFQRLQKKICKEKNQCSKNIRFEYKHSDKYLTKKEKALLGEYYVAHEFIFSISLVLNYRGKLSDTVYIKDFVQATFGVVGLLGISPEYSQIKKERKKFIQRYALERFKKIADSALDITRKKDLYNFLQKEIDDTLISNLNRSIYEFESNLGIYYLNTTSSPSKNLDKHNFKDIMNIDYERIVYKSFSQSLDKIDKIVSFPGEKSYGIFDIKKIPIPYVKAYNRVVDGSKIRELYSAYVQYEEFMRNYTNFDWMIEDFFSKSRVRETFDIEYLDSLVADIKAQTYGDAPIIQSDLEFCTLEKKCKKIDLDSEIKKRISDYIKKTCFYSEGGYSFIYDEKYCPKTLFISTENNTLYENNVDNEILKKKFKNGLPNLKGYYFFLGKYLGEEEEGIDVKEDIKKASNIKGKSCFHFNEYDNHVQIYDYKFEACSKDFEIPYFSGKKIDSFKLGGKTNEGKYKLKSVNTGDYLTWIEFQMFANYGIEKLKLGNRIEKLVDESFKDNNIKEVILPKSLSTYGIGKEVFMNNKLEKVVFEGGGKLSSIQDRAFKNNNIQSLVLSNSIKYISKEVFMNNELASITFPSSLLGFGPKSFMNNKLESVVFPKSTQYISDFAFANNNLKKVSFSGPVKIFENAFDNNNLKVVSLHKDAVISFHYGENKYFPFSNNCLRRKNLDATTLEVLDGFNKEWELTQKPESECNQKTTEIKRNQKETDENKTTEKITISEKMKKKIDTILGKVFLKIDKKGKTQAQKTYKMLLVRIENILKKEMKQSKRNLIEYIQIKIEEKIN